MRPDLSSVTDPVAAERLRLRYPPARIPRPVLVAVVSVLAAGAVGWLVWVAAIRSTPPIAAQVASFTAQSDTRMQVVVTVQRPEPARTGSCRVFAQAVDFQTVAERTVRIAPSTAELTTVRVDLTTLRRGVSAGVSDCVLV